MDMVIRAAAIYMFLLILLRLMGKRTLSEVSTFDFVLLLIIGDATQNALIEQDPSLTTAILVILTLVLLDLALSFLKRFTGLESWVEGRPVVLVAYGQPIARHLRASHVSHDDILQAARLTQGLERMNQIKFAVLETNGGISIIPYPHATP